LSLMAAGFSCLRLSSPTVVSHSCGAFREVHRETSDDRVVVAATLGSLSFARFPRKQYRGGVLVPWCRRPRCKWASIVVGVAGGEEREGTVRFQFGARSTGSPAALVNQYAYIMYLVLNLTMLRTIKGLVARWGDSLRRAAWASSTVLCVCAL